MNYNSIANQRIKDTLVYREILGCASVMVNELQDTDEFRDEVLSFVHTSCQA